MKMKKGGSDLWARGLAIAALAVSVLAVALPELRAHYEWTQTHSEKIGLSLSSHVDGPVIVTPTDFGLAGHVVQFPWQLTVANNSEMPVWFTECRLSCENGLLYSDLNGGLRDPRFVPVRLPVGLAAGETAELYVLVGVLMPQQCFAVVKTLPVEPALTASAVKNALAFAGYDLYGNAVEYKEYPGGGVETRIALREQVAPQVRVTLLTGRGNTFTVRSGYYSTP